MLVSLKFLVNEISLNSNFLDISFAHRHSHHSHRPLNDYEKQELKEKFTEYLKSLGCDQYISDISVERYRKFNIIKVKLNKDIPPDVRQNLPSKWRFGNKMIIRVKYEEFNNEEQTFCTMELKKCPDGSYVSRIGPNCQFQSCPSRRYLYNMSLYAVVTFVLCLVLIPSIVIACIACAQGCSNKKRSDEYIPVEQSPPPYEQPLPPYEPPRYEVYQYPYIHESAPVYSHYMPHR